MCFLLLKCSICTKLMALRFFDNYQWLTIVGERYSGECFLFCGFFGARQRVSILHVFYWGGDFANLLKYSSLQYFFVFCQRQKNMAEFYFLDCVSYIYNQKFDKVPYLFQDTDL
eukprot:TRINITY_DN28474_c1_g2_i1.p5 TRINITY_DN28474_c1_g2~~TRINITY_DN28474_c1_g2_i1.p5  ORF type:complete len:114 (-),score=1.72 TRINITY_DN28474_c1_g2_i1:675-1016(-)